MDILVCTASNVHTWAKYLILLTYLYWLNIYKYGHIGLYHDTDGHGRIWAKYLIMQTYWSIYRVVVVWRSVYITWCYTRDPDRPHTDIHVAH